MRRVRHQAMSLQLDHAMNAWLSSIFVAYHTRRVVSMRLFEARQHAMVPANVNKQREISHLTNTIVHLIDVHVQAREVRQT
jgi:hypothetical protein